MWGKVDNDVVIHRRTLYRYGEVTAACKPEARSGQLEH